MGARGPFTQTRFAGSTACPCMPLYAPLYAPSSRRTRATLGNAHGRTVQPGELESHEVLRKGEDQVLQHCDGHIFTEAEASLSIAPVVNSAKVAAHGD